MQDNKIGMRNVNRLVNHRENMSILEFIVDSEEKLHTNFSKLMIAMAGIFE